MKLILSYFVHIIVYLKLIFCSTKAWNLANLSVLLLIIYYLRFIKSFEDDNEFPFKPVKLLGTYLSSWTVNSVVISYRTYL